MRSRNYLRSVVAAFAFAFSCADNDDDCSVDTDCPVEYICENSTCVPPSSVEGTGGTCVPFEPYPGYETCVLSEPQQSLAGLPLTHAFRQSALLPDSSSLQNIIDQNCPSIHNQGKCGWCVPHSVTGAMEILNCRTQNSDRISEPHLWYAGGGEMDNCKGGWQIELAVEAASNTALLPEVLWPYSSTLSMSLSKPSEEVLQKQARWKIHSSASLLNLQAIKEALAAQQPVVVATPVMCDTGWLWYNSKGKPDVNYGSIIAPAGSIERCVTAGQPFVSCAESKKPSCIIGYHAFTLVGYDDQTQTFALRNSWGTGWANQGYALIEYAFIENYGKETIVLQSIDEVAQEGNSPLGKACTVLYDPACSYKSGSFAGHCREEWPGGSCVIANCDLGDNAQECADLGGACCSYAPISGYLSALCVQGCENDNDCRSEYRCDSFGGGVFQCKKPVCVPRE